MHVDIKSEKFKTAFDEIWNQIDEFLIRSSLGRTGIFEHKTIIALNPVLLPEQSEDTINFIIVNEIGHASFQNRHNGGDKHNKYLEELDHLGIELDEDGFAAEIGYPRPEDLTICSLCGKVGHNAKNCQEFE